MTDKSEATYSREQVINAIKRSLVWADNSRSRAEEIRSSFGEVHAFHAQAWETYGIEYGLEILQYELLKEDASYRNGNRL